MSAPSLRHHPYKWTAGDTAPPLVNAYTDSDGNAIDITSYTFTLVIRRPGAATVLRKVGVITDAVNGLFEFQWVAGDLVEGKNQLCEIEVDDGSGSVETIPEKFFIDVQENIG